MTRIRERMAQAGREPATAYLMQSPLQVTIMTLLVETVGQPPRERWRLFDEYYRIIVRRERERAIPAADLLNAHEADIDVIHQRVGLRLQKQGASTGGTDALLTREEFAALVIDRLEQQGHDGAERERLTGAIITASLERLVFLVSPRDGGIGFEIRSLQEFMAARYLLNGSDEQVRRRLRAIAPLPYWRNVFLFAAGRCFHDREHLRDSIYALCCELNEGTGLNHALLTGSQLALDILEDGAVARQPAQLRLFTRLALRLTELPPGEEQSRLARQYRPEVDSVFQEMLGRALADSSPSRRLGAWRTLLPLVDDSVASAKTLAQANWQRSPEEVTDIVKAIIGQSLGGWVIVRWSQVVYDVQPDIAIFLIRNAAISNRAKPTEESEVWAINQLLEFGKFYSVQASSEHVNVLIKNIPGAPHWGLVSAFPRERVAIPEAPASAQSNWRWICLIAVFLNQPSISALAELLGNLPYGSYSNHFGAEVLEYAPWPVGACVVMIRQGYDRERLADLVLAGELGTPEDWRCAEQRWVS